MNAEIITIGDEILIGQIVDTNSAWIALRLNEIGLRVHSRISVADDCDAIADAVNDAFNSARVVIMTGGLGPTKDDITKKTLAELFGSTLVRDEGTYSMIERMVTERGIEFNGLNRDQALVPDCCTVLPNHNGTAPGMWFERGGQVLVALPGVPFEMMRLMTDEVLPRLKGHFGLRSIVHKTMVTFGLAESLLAEKIAEWEDALPDYLKLAYLPNPTNIRLRLSAYEADRADAEKDIDARFAELEKIIPDYVLGYGEVSVESSVAEVLTAGGLTLSLAESCTGGEIARRFTALPGASAYLLCGMVAYSNSAKVGLLGVEADTLDKYGAVSRQVAEQMALGVRQVAGSDFALSTTGVAGPGGGTEQTPVGTVWIAVAYAGGVVSRKVVLGRLREQNIQRASSTAVNMLRLMLSGRLDAPTSEGVL